jgi:hypothetical protein
MGEFDKPPRYRSYLLSFWEERSQDPDTPVIWRFRLEDPHTGQRRGFASIEKVITFLQTELTNSEGDLDEKQSNKVNAESV